MAEGINLHRANVLVNYDLPWNPTRIMQRVGRINRVGTEYPLFVEALQRKTHLEYLLDILVFGEIEEKALLVMEYGKEVASLEQRISEFTCREAETSIGSSQ